MQNVKPSGLWKRAAQKAIEIAREKDTPHRIALGMALGIFVGVVPIMGIQMAVVTLFALPLRANLKAAIAGVWISNPVTFIPMYYGCYRFGLLITPSHKITWEQFKTVISRASQWTWDDMNTVTSMGTDILIPLFVGGITLGIVAGLPTYFATRTLVARRRFKDVLRLRKQEQKSK